MAEGETSSEKLVEPVTEPHSGKMRPGDSQGEGARTELLSRCSAGASHTTALGGQSTLRESPAISTVPWHAGGTGVQLRDAPQGRGPPRSKTGLPLRAPQHAGPRRGCRHPRPPPATSSCREASSSSAGHCPGLLAGPPVRRSPRESCPNVTPSSNPQSASSPSG